MASRALPVARMSGVRLGAPVSARGRPLLSVSVSVSGRMSSTGPDVDPGAACPVAVAGAEAFAEADSCAVSKAEGRADGDDVAGLGDVAEVDTAGAGTTEVGAAVGPPGAVEAGVMEIST